MKNLATIFHGIDTFLKVSASNQLTNQITPNLIKQVQDSSQRLEDAMAPLLSLKKRDLQRLHNRLIEYHNQLSSRLYQENTPSMRPLIEKLWLGLDQFLQLFQQMHGSDLSLEVPIPIYYWQQSFLKRKQRLENLRQSLTQKSYATIEVNLLIDTLSAYCEQVRPSLTYQQIMYLQTLLYELEELDRLTSETTVLTPLQKCLISNNFNSPLYLKYLIERFQQYATGKAQDPVFLWRLCLKQVEQLPRLVSQPALFPQQESLLNVLQRYLEKEIDFLHSQAPKGERMLVLEGKVQFTCSVDQLGILLRSTADAKLLSAPSYRQLFKAITPLLSTEHQANISAESLRAKSMNWEDKDRKKVLEFIDQLRHCVVTGPVINSGYPL